MIYENTHDYDNQPMKEGLRLAFFKFVGNGHMVESDIDFQRPGNIGNIVLRTDWNVYEGSEDDGYVSIVEDVDYEESMDWLWEAFPALRPFSETVYAEKRRDWRVPFIMEFAKDILHGRLKVDEDFGHFHFGFGADVDIDNMKHNTELVADALNFARANYIRDL